MIIKELLEQARKNLLELGLRNNFINSRDSGLRNVRIIEESSKEVLSILVDKELTMSFKPKGKDEDEIDREFGSLFQVVDVDKVSEQNLTDSILQTIHGPTDLQKRLRGIEKLAKLSIEEKGANILFLCLGFIRWYESDRSEKARIAPILLVPVSIYRNSINSPFKIKFNGDELSFNVSMIEKLKVDFGIKIDIPEELSYTTFKKVIGSLRNAVNEFKRWEVLENEIRLGLYSFSKFLMYRDLDESIWNEKNKPYDHPLLSGLLNKDGFASDIPESQQESEEYGDSVSYKEIYHTLSSDSSQQEVIFYARSGQNIVVQGPPGTGKSQTITNLISDYLARGKKVLFVAEKLAALHVVSRKLDNLGFGDLLLELHSNKAKKNEFISELGRTLKIPRPTYNISIQEELEDYDKVRQILNNYSNALNTEIDNTGFTPFQAFGKVISIENKLGDRIIDTDLEEVEIADHKSFQKKKLIVNEISTGLKKIGPFKDLSYSCISPIKFTFYESEKFILEITKVKERLGNGVNEVRELPEAFRDLVSKFSFSEISKLSNTIEKLKELNTTKIGELNAFELTYNNWELLLKLREITPKLLALKSKKGGLSEKIFEDYWKNDNRSHFQSLSMYSDKWYKIFIRSYRRSRGTLKSYYKNTNENIPDKDLIDHYLLKLEIDESESKLQEIYPTLKDLGGNEYFKVEANWEDLETVVKWLVEYRLGEKDGLFTSGIIELITTDTEASKISFSTVSLASTYSELRSLFEGVHFNDLEKLDEIDLREILELIQNWIDQKSVLNDYIQMLNNINQLEGENLLWLKNIMDTWEHSDSYLTEIFEYNWSRAIARKAFKERKELETFLIDKHLGYVNRFQIQEDRLLKINVFRILEEHYLNLPKSNSASGKLGILLREIAKKRNQKSIRRLINECGQLLLDIKPVFLMSPLSVAQFIETNSIEFDLVIFDEASQIKPVEAFGSILRGKQMIIVGDSKQLPPTSFFDMSGEEEEDEEFKEDHLKTSEVESILSLAEAKSVPGKMLRWHYRSKHDSLITVSNREFYDSNLLVYPSAGSDYSNLGFSYVNTKGTYYEPGKGGKVNRGEAKLIVKEIIEHAQLNPDKSLGVVAFSQAQSKIIEDYLEQELKVNPNKTVEEFIYNSDKVEPFFVKNIENVQGDERDVILISVGYGYQESGKFSYNFGPINKEGGERRLNVLFSRAKNKCVVHSNFKGDEIDLSRTDSYGVKILKAYLNFAEKKELSEMFESQGEADSIFEEEVARAINEAGYETVLQVGSNGFKIDIGVKHPEIPGKFILAVECDGASYHSSKIARDRDKSRQIILESLGWTFYRIWSTDWFLNRQRQSEDLINTIRELIQGKRLTPKLDIESELIDPEITRVEDIESNIPDISSHYNRHIEKIELQDDLHNFYGLIPLIKRIVFKEQPVHKESIITRILEVTGTKKAGNRIRATIDESLERMSKYSSSSEDLIFIKSDTICLDRNLLVPNSEFLIRDRSNLSSREFNFSFIPFVEVQSAILRFIKDSYGATKEEIMTEVPKMFGFKKSTEEMKTIVNAHISKLRSKPLNLIRFEEGTYYCN